jgi:hypothetical protein
MLHSDAIQVEAASPPERSEQVAGKKSSSSPGKFRRADSGRYTTKRYANKHPKTTVKETDRRKK